MAIMNRGAWFIGGGTYTPILRGTNGQDLESDSDNLGWACFAWKYALVKNGFRGEMVLDSPVLGDAARTQIKNFQKAHSLAVDGSIGPHTGERLLRIYFQEAEQNAFEMPAGTYWQIGAQESNFDLGAIGWSDTNDRGPVQTHIYVVNGVPNLTLSQAIRPAYSIPRLGAQISRMRENFDLDTAVASWNVGEGGAEWWYKAGKPISGSPSWWDEEKYGSLAARCWKYITDVRKHEVPSDYYPNV